MRRLSTLPSSLLIGLMALVFVPQAGAFPRAYVQSTAVLQGRVLDQNGAVFPLAQISAQNIATGLGRTGEADSEGNYQIAALPVGNYRVEVKAGGFRTEIVDDSSIEVARIDDRDHQRTDGKIEPTITSEADGGYSATLLPPALTASVADGRTH